MSTNLFISHITSELVAAVNNDFKDNYDYNRFGKLVIPKTPISIRNSLDKTLNKKGYYSNFNNQTFSNKIKDIDFPYSDFFYLYALLEDSFSRDLLVKIVAYRILGHTKIKLPLSNHDFWKNHKRIEDNQDLSNSVTIGFMDLQLPLIDLKFLALPIKMYCSALGINIDFIIKQYELHRGDIDIMAEPGDIVIDAGGCFGDTALYFANLVGKNGKVKVFEFIPNNIVLFRKNIDMNPALSPMIELIEQPLWNHADVEIHFQDNGPASKVAFEYFEAQTGGCMTTTIDEYVSKTGLQKVDLIKMDIEGAETNALEGAKETIKKYRPKLAIALYHSTKDFDSIPRFINELELGYRFFLSHATIYGEETMLFAKV